MPRCWPRRWAARASYAVYVGSLTVPLHNAWADAAIAYLKENYPDMKLIGDRYGVAENVDDSRKTALDLIAANPDPQGLPRLRQPGPDRHRPRSGGDPQGRRDRRVRSLLSGPGPSSSSRKARSAAASCGTRWKPAGSSSASATCWSNGEVIADGTTIEGLGVVHPDGTNIIVDALIPINKDSVDELADLGL